MASFTSGSSLSPQDPNNVRGSYGPAEYDVRHSLNANFLWELPIRNALRVHGPRPLTEGWQVSGTVFARTGFPYTVFDASESQNLTGKNYFGAIYAVPVGPISPQSACGKGAATPPAPHPCLPPQVLSDGTTPNPKALFIQSGCETGFNKGQMGSSLSCMNGPVVSFAQGRNRFRGPDYFNIDFAVMKNTKLPHWENGRIGIGIQFFNLFNHPNFGFPRNDISDPQFGQIIYLESPPTTILGSGLGGDASPRMIQLKLTLQF